MRDSEKFKGFDVIKDTIFLKKFSKENSNLKKLESMSQKIIDSNIKRQIEREISLMKWGLEGENNVYFELKNSLLPMICLHDIRIEVGDLNAQIDFLILTNKFFYIFETKHLVGDILINKEGDFIRITNDEFGFKKEEGMYNPVTQGERHSRILKKFFEINGLLNLEDFPIKSVAILANPKTILNKESAPNHIKDNIYRCDQIVHFLQREFSNNSYDIMISDSKLENIGLELLKHNSPIEYNYNAKYSINSDIVNDDEKNKVNKKSSVVELEPYKKTKENLVVKPEKTLEPEKSLEIKAKFSKYNSSDNLVLEKDELNSREKIESELREIRKLKAKELKIEAYKLFTNKQLNKLLNNMPKSLKDLRTLDIIPKKGYYHLGESIIKIINKHCEDDFNEECIIRNKLETYRRNKSRELSLPEYKIFTNSQLRDVLKLRPSNIKELYEVSGFNKYHIDNYGQDILNLIKSIRNSLCKV